MLLKQGKIQLLESMRAFQSDETTGGLEGLEGWAAGGPEGWKAGWKA